MRVRTNLLPFHLPWRAQTRALAVSYLPEWAILALAALVRFWRLDYHSFWFDEAVSLAWAGADMAYTWDKTFALVEEKHPPAYYLTLHLWRRLLDGLGLGQSDAALRALGALLGVLTVLGVLLLAVHLCGRRIGRLAALLVALSPALVWYSQELRMFQPAATAIVWGIYLAVRGAEATGEGNRAIAARLLCWLGMVLALTYALYSYLFAAFALPGLGLSLLLLCRQQGRLHWRRLGEGVLALGITAALFLPLASNAWLVNSDQSPPGQLFGEFLPYLWRQLRTFTIWQAAWPELLAGAALLLFALLALLGYVLPGTDGRQARTRLLLLLWTAPPLLIAGVLQATNANVLKEDRYFLYLAPFVLWAVARGAVLLGRWRRLLPTAAGGLAVILLLAALPTLWTPRLLRENWRGTAAYIAAYQEASPALPAAGVIHADYLYGSLDWYLGQSFTFTDLPVYQVFNGPISDADMAVIAPRLAGIEASGAETLWLVQSHLEGIDDERRLQHWLDERYPVATEQFPAGIELTGYALRTVYTALPALAGPATYPGAELAPGLVLAACEITTPVIHRAAESLTDAGGRVHVRLWWQATEALAEDYRSNIQVTGAAGVWGRELPQANGTLRHYPTSAWPVGAYIRHEVDILLNPATPTGQSYTVLAGLQGADGAPLKQTVACGEVGVGE